MRKFFLNYSIYTEDGTLLFTDFLSYAKVSISISALICSHRDNILCKPYSTKKGPYHYDYARCRVSGRRLKAAPVLIIKLLFSLQYNPRQLLIFDLL
jgi:hypothetical protein